MFESDKEMSRTIVCLLLSFFLVSCDMNDSDIVLKNAGPSAVKNVTISDGMQVWSLGDIAPGQTVGFSKHLKGEGGPTISWTSDHKRYSDKGCYYTGGSPARGSISIEGANLSFHCK